MNKSLNVWIARALLPLFTVTAILFPASSYAFAPAPIGLAGLTTSEIAALPGAAVSSGTPVGVALFAGSAALSVGMSLGYLAMEYAFEGQTEVVRIPLTSDPAMAVPAPSAPSTATPQTVSTWAVAMSTTAVANAINGGNPVYYTTSATDACTKSAQVFTAVKCIQYGSPASCMSYTGDYGGGTSCTITTPSFGVVPSQMAAPTTVTSCSSGYTLSGGTCILQDARVATPDHACDLARSGSALAMISDPDCAKTLADGSSAIPIICEAGGCAGAGTSATGQPRSFVITPQPNGGSQVSTWEQQTVNGQTQVRQSVVTVDGGGVVTQISGDVQAGSIPSGAYSPSAATSPVASVTPTVQTGTQVLQQPQTVTIDPTPDPCLTNPDRAGCANLGSAPTAELIPSLDIPVSFTPVSFASNASCPSDIGFDVFGAHYAISYQPFCNLMGYMRPFFLAFGAIAAAYIFVEGLKT